MLAERLIHDCDPGPDDAVTLFLLRRLLPQLPLGVVSCFGCNSLAHTNRNACRVADLLGADIRVEAGAAAALAGTAPAHTFFGSDGFNDVWGDEPPEELPAGQGSVPTDFAGLAARLFAAEGPVDYVLTGPCTNLAGMLQAAEEHVRRRVRRVYLMGGALDSAGNSGPLDPETGNLVCEFNFMLDPKAAALVLERLPVCLVTWDEAKRLRFSRPVLERVRPGSAAASLIVRALRRFFELYPNDNIPAHELEGPEAVLVLADVLTVLAILGLGSFEPARVSVETSGPFAGRLRRDESGYPVTLFRLGDPTRAQALILQELERVVASER